MALPIASVNRRQRTVPAEWNRYGAVGVLPEFAVRERRRPPTEGGADEFLSPRFFHAERVRHRPAARPEIHAFAAHDRDRLGRGHDRDVERILVGLVERIARQMGCPRDSPPE